MTRGCIQVVSGIEEIIFKYWCLNLCLLVFDNKMPKVWLSGRCGVRGAECGARSVENAECGKRGVWKVLFDSLV